MCILVSRIFSQILPQCVGISVVSRGQTFFLFVIGSREKKGSGDPSIEILCSRIDRNCRVLTSHKEVFNNLPVMYCRRDLMSRTVNRNKNIISSHCLSLGSFQSQLFSALVRRVSSDSSGSRKAHMALGGRRYSRQW